MHPPSSLLTGQSKAAAVFRVATGNFLEQFDFFLFGFYTAQIANVFFPIRNEFASLMMTFAVFDAGFLIRPLGTVVLGAYIDDAGRRKSLIVMLSTMASETVLTAFIPGYATIGLLVPALVLLRRLLQGFSAGAEPGGVSVYLAEMATPGCKDFFTSWQPTSQQVVIVVAAGLGFVFSQQLGAPAIAAWGWRVPFFVGCMIMPFIFVLRHNLEETQEFNAHRRRPSMREVFDTLLQSWGVIVADMMLVAITMTSFHLITVYAPTFGRTVLHLSTADSLLVTLYVGVSNFMWLSIGEALSNRIGRRPLLIGITVLTIATAYLTLSLLALTPSFVNMLLMLLWLSFMYDIYNGAMVVAPTEVVPVQMHVAGFSPAYNLATAMSGGFTPAILTAIIHVTSDKTAPDYWMSFAATCTLIATLTFYRRRVLTLASAC